MLSPDFLLKATFVTASEGRQVCYGHMIIMVNSLFGSKSLAKQPHFQNGLRSSAFPLVFHFVELSNDGNHHPYTSNFDALLAMSKLMNAWQNSACNLHVDNCCFKEPAHFVFNALMVKLPTLSNVLSQLYRKINQARVDFADGLFAW